MVKSLASDQSLLNPILPLTAGVAFSNLVKFSVPQFPHFITVIISKIRSDYTYY